MKSKSQIDKLIDNMLKLKWRYDYNFQRGTDFCEGLWKEYQAAREKVVKLCLEEQEH